MESCICMYFCPPQLLHNDRLVKAMKTERKHGQLTLSGRRTTGSPTSSTPCGPTRARSPACRSRAPSSNSSAPPPRVIRLSSPSPPRYPAPPTARRQRTRRGLRRAHTGPLNQPVPAPSSMLDAVLLRLRRGSWAWEWWGCCEPMLVLSFCSFLVCGVLVIPTRKWDWLEEVFFFSFGLQSHWVGAWDGG